MIEFQKFIDRYYANFGSLPYKENQSGVKREWENLANRMSEHEFKHVWEIVRKSARSTRPGVVDFENAIKEVKDGDNIEPMGLHKITLPDCWACSDGMMEVPIAISGTEKEIGFSFADGRKVDRVDTCHAFCLCKRGQLEKKLMQNFFPCDDSFSERAFRKLESIRETLVERFNVGKRENLDHKEQLRRKLDMKNIRGYFHFAICTINAGVDKWQDPRYMQGILKFLKSGKSDELAERLAGVLTI